MACEGARQPAGAAGGDSARNRDRVPAVSRGGVQAERAGGSMPARGRRAELQRDGPRLAISAWQSFDRSFATMLATMDDPGADLRAYATMFKRLADAAEAGAAALHDSDINAALASGAFCGKRSRQVRRLIAGPRCCSAIRASARA